MNHSLAIPVLCSALLLSGCMDAVSHGLDTGSDAERAQDELQAQAFMNQPCSQLRLQKAALEPSVTGPRLILLGAAASAYRGQYDGIVEAMRRKGCSE